MLGHPIPQSSFFNQCFSKYLVYIYTPFCCLIAADNLFSHSVTIFIVTLFEGGRI